MWINQSEPEQKTGVEILSGEQAVSETELLKPVLPEPEPDIHPAEQKAIDPERAALPMRPDAPQRLAARSSLPSRDCVLLTAAYLLGAFLAGMAGAYHAAGKNEALNYYLTCWQNLFSVENTAQIVGLFRTEFLTLAGVLTALLLLGLSALGPLPIFLFMILYGTGSGLLSLTFLQNSEPAKMIALFVVSGIPSAFAAGIMCTFGAFALQASGRLYAFAFQKGGQVHSVKHLFGPFVCALVLLLPLCGMAVGLLYLAEQTKLF